MKQNSASPKLLIVTTIVLCAVVIYVSFLTHTPSAQAQPPAATAVHTGLRQRTDLPPIGVSYEKETPLRSDAVRAATACSKFIEPGRELRGVTHVAVQQNDTCYNADIDTFTRAGHTYVVQGGGYEAAFTITDVTNPAQPNRVHYAVWDRAYTYTPDIKTFRQGANDYIAISMERYSTSAYCGVVIYDVSDPANPALQSQNDGADWCDVHNLFVEDDANGDGAYIYITANATRDMRVLDISGQHGGSVTAPQEIGRYTLPGASYIHDVTVLDHSAHSDGRVGRRVYISYWERGLVILNAADVTPGTNPTPVVGADIIDPAGFRVHHAMASPDGELVFIQDEYLQATGNEPVQMWSVSDTANPAYVDGLRLGTDTPLNTAHNLETRWDIHPNRLYVGWYKLGLQAWDYTASGFTRNYPAPRTAVLYHQVQTGATDSIYAGAWGVRLDEIDGGLYVFQSDYRYGLIIDCIACPAAVTPTVTPTPTGTTTSTPNATSTGTATATVTSTPTLTPTATPTVTVTAPVTATVIVTSTPIPTATVTPTGTIPVLPLTASQTVTLSVDADRNGVVSPSDTLRFTVQIHNNSDGTLTGVFFSEGFGAYLGVLADSVQNTAGVLTSSGTTLLPSIDIAIGDIAPDTLVTITFDARLRDDIPAATSEIAVQGTLRADGMDVILTDDPITASFGDPTVIRVTHATLPHRIYAPIVVR